MGASPPQSVEKITRIAQDYEYNPLIPLRNWLRTASTLLREVGYPATFSAFKAHFLFHPRLEYTNGKAMTSKHTYCYFDMRN
jgi:hypothetical protein